MNLDLYSILRGLLIPKFAASADLSVSGEQVGKIRHLGVKRTFCIDLDLCKARP
jgi:hypothetical protein